jgi:hypothetical protein
MSATSGGITTFTVPSFRRIARAMGELLQNAVAKAQVPALKQSLSATFTRRNFAQQSAFHLHGASVVAEALSE